MEPRPLRWGGPGQGREWPGPRREGLGDAEEGLEGARAGLRALEEAGLVDGERGRAGEQSENGQVLLREGRASDQAVGGYDAPDPAPPLPGGRDRRPG